MDVSCKQLEMSPMFKVFVKESVWASGSKGRTIGW